MSAQLLPNGDFEKGKLENWENQSFGQASVEIVQRESCFSQLDTQKIQVRGKYAARFGYDANQVSSKSKASFAALRSSAFLAGDGFAFIALRGELIGKQNSTSDKVILESELALQLEILDARTDSVLVSQNFIPSTVQLFEGCPSTPVQGRFSSHYFDTRSFSGLKIKIQFKQIVDSTASQRFTLIDQLVIFQNGEQALFFSRPYAQAGISMTSSGISYLDSRGSFDPDRKPLEMRYSWWLKDRHYDLAEPCLINIPSGSHQAVLYVNDGQHAISDSLQFHLHATVAQANLSGDLQCDQPIAPTAQSVLVPEPGKVQK